MGEDLPKVKQVSLRPSPKSSPGKVKVHQIQPQNQTTIHFNQVWVFCLGRVFVFLGLCFTVERHQLELQAFDGLQVGLLCKLSGLGWGSLLSLWLKCSSLSNWNSCPIVCSLMCFWFCCCLLTQNKYVVALKVLFNNELQQLHIEHQLQCEIEIHLISNILIFCAYMVISTTKYYVTTFSIIFLCAVHQHSQMLLPFSILTYFLDAFHIPMLYIHTLLHLKVVLPIDETNIAHSSRTQQKDMKYPLQCGLQYPSTLTIQYFLI